MLRDLIRRAGPFARLAAAWRHDFDLGTKPIRKDLRTLTARVEQLQAQLEATTERANRGDRLAAQIRLTLQSEQDDREWLARASAILDPERIRNHVRQAIDAAPLLTDPFDHIVVDRLLPDDAWDLIIRTRPPAVFFDDRDPVKQDLSLPIPFGPALMRSVWQFFDETLAHGIIRPAVIEKFDAPLQRHIDEAFGVAAREQALALPPSTTSGRLALRRPGYALPPHRDPKRAMLTCLIYLAAPGDDETHGTHLFSVEGDSEVDRKQTFCPEDVGHACTLAKTVPFRANSMLVFLNQRGAHSANIPKDAPPVERYTYQFYVAPDTDALTALLKTLPPERKVMWENHNRK